VPGATSCYVAVGVCPQHWLLATTQVAQHSLFAPSAAHQASRTAVRPAVVAFSRHGRYGRQGTASHSLDVSTLRRCADGWKTVNIERMRFDGCACPTPLSLLVASLRPALVRNGMLASVRLQQSVTGGACRGDQALRLQDQHSCTTRCFLSPCALNAQGQAREVPLLL